MSLVSVIDDHYPEEETGWGAEEPERMEVKKILGREETEYLVEELERRYGSEYAGKEFPSHEDYMKLVGYTLEWYDDEFADSSQEVREATHGILLLIGKFLDSESEWP